MGAYVTYLQKERVNLKLVVGPCPKWHFRFGDGKVLQCNPCILLPAFYRDHGGVLLAFVIPESALKPTTEQLELVLDIQKGFVRLERDREWMWVQRGQVTNAS